LNAASGAEQKLNADSVSETQNSWINTRTNNLGRGNSAVSGELVKRV
jgi:hypothetical protein